MPELPEVEIVRQSLNKKIKQKVVKKVLIRNRNLRFKIPLNFSRYLVYKGPNTLESSMNYGGFTLKILGLKKEIFMRK